MPAIICVAGVAEIERTRLVALHAAEVQMSRLSIVLAEQTGRAIETVFGALRSVAESVDLASMKTGDRLDPLDNFMREGVDPDGPLAGIAIVDSAGRILCSTFGVDTPVSPDQTEALLDSIRPGTPSAAIGKPFRNAAGQWTLLVTRRIDSVLSGMGGYAVGFVNLTYFETFYRSVQLSKNGAVSLLHSDGRLLVRYPHIESAIGTVATTLGLSREILSKTDTTTNPIRVSPFDGIRRVRSVRTVQGMPLIVTISEAESSILKSWQEPAIVMAVIALFASVIIGGALLRLSRRARRREALTVELSAARVAALQANRSLAEQMVERERNENALRQAQRLEAVGKLSSGAAHDFNNLLTVVMTNLEMLLETAQWDSEDRAILLQAQAAAGRGAVLTKQLLAFSRQLPLSLTPVDTRNLLLGMKDLLHTALGDAITLDMQLDAHMAAMADANQLELMVLNLALNAHDAMPNGGAVTIATRDVVQPASRDATRPGPDDYVLIEVADTGCGMSEDVRSMAFDPFFTTKKPGAGSGLGLSQVYGLARQSGGRAEIESKLDHGTTVRVWLPQANEDLPAPVKAPATPPLTVSKELTILVVDDDAAVRSATVRMLRRSGYTVLEDDAPKAALERLIADTAIHMVISDIVMPGMNGLDLARAVRDVRPDLPFIFISGYADPANVAASTDRVRLLRKPFRASELIAEIEAVLIESKGPAGVL